MIGLRNAVARLTALFRPRPRLPDEILMELAELAATPAIIDLADDAALNLGEVPSKVAAALLIVRAGAAARAESITADQATAAIVDALRMMQAGKGA
jgi:hypothetical protein